MESSEQKADEVPQNPNPNPPSSSDVTTAKVTESQPPAQPTAERIESQPPAQPTTERTENSPPSVDEPPHSAHFTINVMEVDPPSPDATEATGAPPETPSPPPPESRESESPMRPRVRLPLPPTTDPQPHHIVYAMRQEPMTPTSREGAVVVSPKVAKHRKFRPPVPFPQIGISSIEEPNFAPSTPELLHPSPVKANQGTMVTLADIEAATHPLCRTKELEPQADIDATTHPLCRTQEMEPVSYAESPPWDVLQGIERVEAKSSGYFQACAIMSPAEYQSFVNWQEKHGFLFLGYITNPIHFYKWKQYVIRTCGHGQPALNFSSPGSSKTLEKMVQHVGLCGHPVHPATHEGVPWYGYCPVCYAKVLLELDKAVRRA